MKSSPSIWHYVENVKLSVKILSTFLENKNFNIRIWCKVETSEANHF